MQCTYICVTTEKISQEKKKQYLLSLKKHEEIIEIVRKCLETSKQITIRQSLKIKVGNL